ncbi:MAG: hypothetical protein WAN04_07240 [Candidatus Udaeobacter sp.]
MSLEEHEERVERERRMYQDARGEYALWCRLNDETYKQIGLRLGVSAGQARVLAQRGSRIQRRLQMVRKA